MLCKSNPWLHCICDLFRLSLQVNKVRNYRWEWHHNFLVSYWLKPPIMLFPHLWICWFSYNSMRTCIDWRQSYNLLKWLWLCSIYFQPCSNLLRVHVILHYLFLPKVVQQGRWHLSKYDCLMNHELHR